MFIKKYRLVTKRQTIIIPKNAEILNAVFFKDEIYLYAKIDQNNETEFREFFCANEGENTDYKETKFINSLVAEDVVIHVFEVLKR